MAKNQTVRIRPAVLQEDKEALAALQGMADYRPSNPAYKMENLQAALKTMTAQQEAEVQAQAAFAAARDGAVASEWEFHNAMLGAKDQVIAQYGKDSEQVQAIGLKRVSERKSPQRKPKTVPSR